MKFLKIESLISMIVFLFTSLISLIFGVMHLAEQPYRNTGLDYFKILTIVIILAIVSAFNMIYYFYLLKEEKEGYYYPKEANDN